VPSVRANAIKTLILVVGFLKLRFSWKILKFWFNWVLNFNLFFSKLYSSGACLIELFTAVIKYVLRKLACLLTPAKSADNNIDTSLLHHII